MLPCVRSFDYETFNNKNDLYIEQESARDEILRISGEILWGKRNTTAPSDVRERRSARSYNIPRTSVAITFVLKGTDLSAPCQGRTFPRRCVTSSRNFDRILSDAVIITKESSVSNRAERALRLVDPNRLNIGAEFESGDTHIPLISTVRSEETFIIA